MITLYAFKWVHAPAYRSIQPWGQVAAIEEAGLVLFESAAIVQYLADRSEALPRRDPANLCHPQEEPAFDNTPS